MPDKQLLLLLLKLLFRLAIHNIRLGNIMHADGAFAMKLGNAEDELDLQFVS